MQPIRRIRHCRCCGSPVEYWTPPDDNRERAVCTTCGEIHYENPLNVVGTIPTWADRVLLCRRAIEPRRGLWTLPAGFMELGETTAEGALRETHEEAGAHIELQGLFALMNLASVGQVHLFIVRSFSTRVSIRAPRPWKSRYIVRLKFPGIPWRFGPFAWL
ncbi:ADP-ribose pyrophosphatase [Leptothrix ochracea L12]|uniref:ADP-ribose pyrophosphatase n=1 Tax=Leptothrix ochracea L12 TaxID=735332 RepID=I4Z5U2_9BURK|nr:ADP-ribose pyrophosphatase [Leptothrix ochracea L12]